MDFREFVLDRLDQLDRLHDADVDPQKNTLAYAAAAATIGDMAARLGHADLYRRSLDFGPYAEWPDVKAYLSACLAAVPAPGEPLEPAPIGSPWLDSRQSADYLGITVRSLNGLVARGRLEPARGPRRQYRFTREQLDAYLLCQSQSLKTADVSNSR